MLVSRMKLCVFSLFFISSLFSMNLDIDTLAEKVVEEKNANKKEQLLKQLKQKLAKANHEAKELASAVIREKRKLPLHIFKEKKSE